MRSLRIRDGVREARKVLSESGRLMGRWPIATLELGIVLALVPALLRALFASQAYAALLDDWMQWLSGATRTESGFIAMVNETFAQSSPRDLGGGLVDMARSLILTPLLLCSLALLYNQLIAPSGRAALDAVTRACRSVRRIILVAVACLIAEAIVQMVPSLITALLSLISDLFAFIPVVGTVVTVIAVILSVLVSLVTSFAVTVIFSYVWISAMCEGVSGIGSIVRSWQLTRNAMHESFSALLALTLLRWGVLLIVCLLWIWLGVPAGVSPVLMVYAFYITGALYTLCLGSVTSALYQRRPAPDAASPGQFRARPDFDTMKRANID